MRPKSPKPKSSEQRSFYIAAEYTDSGDRLLVENRDGVDLYSIDLALAQHWYAAAWRGNPLDLTPFASRLLDEDIESARARAIKQSGLVLAQCLRHGQGMPIVDEINGHPVHSAAIEVLIGEVFEGALSYLVEQATGIAGLTISPMHTGYALNEGRRVGAASVQTIAERVAGERPDIGVRPAPDGTVTILFSDIVGSTVLNEAMGDARWMELLREHNRLVRHEIRMHHGHEVKTIGDAFMVAFQSSKQAIRCAVAIQSAFTRRNELAVDPIHLRIGLHTGELVRDQEDFFGWHVNFAARVAAEATADEILVSSLVRDVAHPSGEFSFHIRPKRSLKGFKGTHVLHAVENALVSVDTRSRR